MLSVCRHYLRLRRDATMQNMISLCQPLSSGNAIRIFVEPPVGSLSWRVLRKSADTFTGEADTGALVVYEGDSKVFVDTESLTNDIAAYYKPYYWNGTAWTAAATTMAIPRATYEDASTDVPDFVRDRLAAGLLVEVQRSNIVTDIGYIQVFTAPPSPERDIRFPLVTVMIEEEHQEARSIGEDFAGDILLDDGDWGESEGWMARVQLSITGWSLNPEERNELRKALRRIIVANLPVFSDRGMDLVEFSQNNSDATNGEFGDAPVFMTVGTFSCIAPVRVGSRVDPITDVEVEGNSYV